MGLFSLGLISIVAVGLINFEDAGWRRGQGRGSGRRLLRRLCETGELSREPP